MAANKTSSLGAAVHGMADARLARLAADYEIPLREPGRPTNHGYDPDWLYDQYVNQARPLPAIAWWGLGSSRSGSGELGAVGGIVGVYGRTFVFYSKGSNAFAAVRSSGQANLI